MKSFVLILLLSFSRNVFTASQLDAPVLVNGVLNELYDAFMVNETTAYLFEYTFPASQLDGGVLRVYVESDESKSVHPVIVVVRHEHGVLSWEIPMKIADPDFPSGVSYTAVNRTICPYNQIREDLETNATLHRTFISVSSASLVSVSFKMSLYVEAMYQVSMNTSYTAMVNPGAPQYFKFMWPTTEDDMAILAVDSNDSFCMTVSVQNLTCPLNDLNSNVDFEGIYQTVDTKTGMSVRPGGAGADMTELSLARTSAPASCPGPGTRAR